MVDLNATVAETQRVFESVVGNSIRLRSNLDPSLGSVAGDHRKIRSLVVNLFLGARDATPAGEELVVTTSLLNLESAVAGCALAPGRYAELRFETRREIKARELEQTVGEIGGGVKVQQLGERFSISVALPRY